LYIKTITVWMNVMSPVLRFLARIATGCCILAGVFLLYVVLGDRPFGAQFVTLVAYSIAVFFYVFCDTRFLRGFDFYSEASKRSAPRLLSIHGSVLILIFAIQTLALKQWTRLPPWWITKNGPRDDSPLEFAFFILIFALGTIQVVSLRKILSNAEKQNRLV
jgi:hypothetical protein